MWHTLSIAHGADTKEITARVCTSADSFWFDGHFPDEPILPGIGQLGMVADVLGAFFDRPVTVTGVRRVKFRRLVRPGEELSITAKQKTTNAYSFRMTTGSDEMVSSGIMTIALNKEQEK